MSLHVAVVIIRFLSPTERRRQGKFQPFRRLFGRKKKERQAKGGSDGAEPKGSVSPGEVCNGVVSDDEESNPNLRSVHGFCSILTHICLGNT